MTQNDQKTQKIKMNRPPFVFYPAHFLNQKKQNYFKEIEECMETQLTMMDRPEPNPLFMKKSKSKSTKFSQYVYRKAKYSF